MGRIDSGLIYTCGYQAISESITVHSLDNALHIVEIAAQCEEDCDVESNDSCQRCSLGYYKSDNECLINQCTCSNGTPVANGVDCVNHGSNTCQSCDAGYSLFDQKCVLLIKYHFHHQSVQMGQEDAFNFCRNTESASSSEKIQEKYTIIS